MDRSLVVALAIGAIQGVFEWLPISSEGNVALVLAALGRPPETAVAFALFLHLGTAASATGYYRGEVRAVLARVPDWRPARAFEGEQATVSFLGIATLVSGVVGLAAYATLETVVSALTGGAFVALVGALLVATGAFQRVAATGLGEKARPDATDAVLVGVAQGVAILPGVSRSGTTTGALLLRGHDAPAAFRLSFVLSIPAAIGGGLLAFLDAGLAGVTATAALLALATAAVVGYATIDALMRVVARASFWAVCVGLGGLAILGGLLVGSLP